MVSKHKYQPPLSLIQQHKVLKRPWMYLCQASGSQWTQGHCKACQEELEVSCKGRTLWQEKIQCAELPLLLQREAREIRWLHSQVNICLGAGRYVHYEGKIGWNSYSRGTSVSCDTVDSHKKFILWPLEWYFNFLKTKKCVKSMTILRKIFKKRIIQNLIFIYFW